jgi:glycosyltransferase involved in cell wall biosynthesis
MPREIGKAAKKLGVPFIYLLHDLYPDELIKTSNFFSNSNPFTAILIKQLKKSTSETFSMANKIIVVGRDVKDYLIHNYQVDSAKIEVITNWAPKLEKNSEESIRKLRTKAGFNDKFVLMHTGNIGVFQDFNIVLLAIREIQNIDKDILLVIIGNGGKKTLYKNLRCKIN